LVDVHRLVDPQIDDQHVDIRTGGNDGGAAFRRAAVAAHRPDRAARNFGGDPPGGLPDHSLLAAVDVDMGAFRRHGAGGGITQPAGRGGNKAALTLVTEIHRDSPVALLWFRIDRGLGRRLRGWGPPPAPTAW